MRVGIIGRGAAGKRHAQNGVALGHETCAHDPAAGFTHMKRDGLIDWADAIVIATPSECHLQDLKDCLDANKPVLVEKPIGLVGQSRAISQLLHWNEEKKAKPIPVAVGYNLRFHPAVTKAREWLQKHTPYYASFGCWQYCNSKAAMIDGCLNHWATHEIDLAQHLLGPLRKVDATITPLEVDLTLKIWDHTKPPCHVVIHSDMRAEYPLRSVSLVSDDDALDYDIQHSWPVTKNHYKAELASFLNWVETGQHDGILATGYDGLLTLQLCEKAAGGYGMLR